MLFFKLGGSLIIIKLKTIAIQVSIVLRLLLKRGKFRIEWIQQSTLFALSDGSRHVLAEIVL